MDAPSYNVLIASFLESELVEQIRQVDNRLNVIYEPELLRSPRYPADHTGEATTRSAEDEARWRILLGEADILFDFDQTHLADLPELARRVQWIQGTSAGIGQFVRQMGYDQRMPQTVFTTASGVHARPLAEFCIMAMLVFSRGLLRVLRDQRARHWERYAGSDLAGKRVAIIGTGNIGREVARLSREFGLHVAGNKRRVEGLTPADLYLDELYGPDQLIEMLHDADYVVLITPHTPETSQLIGTPHFAAMRKGAVFINIGRGAVVDESALIEALQSGHLGGAALDVFEQEPLPVDSPLWELPNVIVSPHSASTSDRENQRITELFCENLRRFLSGQPLINVLDTDLLY